MRILSCLVLAGFCCGCRALDLSSVQEIIRDVLANVPLKDGAGLVPGDLPSDVWRLACTQAGWLDTCKHPSQAFVVGVGGALAQNQMETTRAVDCMVRNNEDGCGAIQGCEWCRFSTDYQSQFGNGACMVKELTCGRVETGMAVLKALGAQVPNVTEQAICMRHSGDQAKCEKDKEAVQCSYCKLEDVYGLRPSSNLCLPESLMVGAKWCEQLQDLPTGKRNIWEQGKQPTEKPKGFNLLLPNSPQPTEKEDDSRDPNENGAEASPRNEVDLSGGESRIGEGNNEIREGENGASRIAGGVTSPSGTANALGSGEVAAVVAVGSSVSSSTARIPSPSPSKAPIPSSGWSPRMQSSSVLPIVSIVTLAVITMT